MKEIKVLMLGGKRCGKTTVLSSMYSSINSVLAGTGLSISVDDPSTQAELDRARRAIIDRMEQFKKPLTSCEVDDNPTSAERSYSFSLRREVNGKGKGGGIPFRIHDIPGEWLTDQNAGKVKELIVDCQVILIAIDTPYLFAKMTDKGYGQYHEKYNKPIEITNFFKNSLSVDDLRDRMILFVPIKCERYYHLDRSVHLREFGRRYMQEVTQAVRGLPGSDPVSALHRGPGGPLHHCRDPHPLSGRNRLYQFPAGPSDRKDDLLLSGPRVPAPGPGRLHPYVLRPAYDLYSHLPAAPGLRRPAAEKSPVSVRLQPDGWDEPGTDAGGR